ncbi:MAG: hypothetical protein A3F10_03915 [Coxiella sp. RIFCSPHIGHO2_12_FULL_42_15]|nr:MAG: hypothetical protein A3F10_03915 [Coxiella sp. RIFCSPHIGHO2_12_FULL_42_15]
MNFHAQRGSVFLLALFFIALVSLLLNKLLMHHQLAFLLLSNKMDYSIAFQAAEEGLYFAYQQIPQLGVWHRSMPCALTYRTTLQREDRCQNKIFALYSSARVKKTRVNLTAVVVKPSLEVKTNCPLPPYFWHWQQ